MRPLLMGIAASQGGLFARRQALACGYTRREFEHLTRRHGGQWHRVRYGIYIERASWEPLDDAAQARLLDRAALISCDSGTVLSHSSAARALRLPLYDAEDGLVHVTRRRDRGRILTGIEAGIKHHGGQITDEEIDCVEGLAVTNAIRTTLDVTSEFGYRAGLVIADSALGSGIARSALQAAVDAHPTDPGHAARQAVVTDADGRAQTPIETLCRIVVKSVGIPDVVPQQHFEFLADPDAFVDLYSPRFHHVFECDGKDKYQQQTNPYGEVLKPEDILWLEKKREDLLRGRGLGVSRLVWADTYPDAFERVRARLRREIRQQNAAGLFSVDQGHS